MGESKIEVSLLEGEMLCELKISVNDPIKEWMVWSSVQKSKVQSNRTEGLYFVFGDSAFLDPTAKAKAPLFKELKPYIGRQFQYKFQKFGCNKNDQDELQYFEVWSFHPREYVLEMELKETSMTNPLKGGGDDGSMIKPEANMEEEELSEWMQLFGCRTRGCISVDAALMDKPE
ncbi:unnamed protein product [Brassica rapa]|uniref:Uncharacterized protein n=1 Tax=Brassica campestris TaxID=3711 RepID=A0A3P6CGS3_BRACM|nr:unnamed protein product [Brassica rapa]VDD12204.1 unnamed protein product [Brassica rapa]